MKNKFTVNPKAIITLLFLPLSLLFFSQMTLAEDGCPDGMTPGQIQGQQTPSCYAIPGYSSQPQQQQAPRGHWEDRWGAIAIGSTASGGGVGLIKNVKSKQAAQQLAMSDCKSTGGGAECRISLTYYNQCAVIAWGDKIAFTQGAETIEIASQLAMSTCGTKDTNCKILYSACSLPVWISN